MKKTVKVLEKNYQDRIDIQYPPFEEDTMLNRKEFLKKRKRDITDVFKENLSKKPEPITFKSSIRDIVKSISSSNARKRSHIVNQIKKNIESSDRRR